MLYIPLSGDRRSNDLSTRLFKVSKDAPTTLRTASRLKPPRKTDKRRNASRSGSVNNFHEFSEIARMLRWRSGTSRTLVSKKSIPSESSSTISGVVNMLTQPAASSSAIGSPSIISQIW